MNITRRGLFGLIPAAVLADLLPRSLQFSAPVSRRGPKVWNMGFIDQYAIELKPLSAFYPPEFDGDWKTFERMGGVHARV